MSNYYFLWLCTEQWELIYYVAFIILTIGLVIFTASNRKTARKNDRRN